MIKDIVIKVVPKPIKRHIKKQLRKLLSKEYPILINPESIHKPIFHVKDATWESVIMPEVYLLMKEWKNHSYSPEQDILEIPHCTVRSYCDIIIDGNGMCIWDKFYFSIFCKMVPQDYGLVSYNEHNVRLQTPKMTIPVEGECISLLGVHESIWTHFFIQFLPKLYYSEEAGLLDKENISILFPDYADANIKELIEDVLVRHPNVKRIICQKDPRIVYQCEKLYYIPTPSTSTNNSDYILPFDMVIPKRVTDILRNNIILPRQNKIDMHTDTPKKLYLVRRSTYRGMVNYQEVEDYFIKQGFTLVEPHKLSLQKKAEIFYGAEIIVGPASGAWTNVMFCKKAKGLFLNTLCRTIDAYSKYIMQLGNVKVLQVTGWDLLTSGIHSDYKISIDKIDAAYKQLIGE